MTNKSALNFSVGFWWVDQVLSKGTKINVLGGVDSDCSTWGDHGPVPVPLGAFSQAGGDGVNILLVPYFSNANQVLYLALFG